MRLLITALLLVTISISAQDFNMMVENPQTGNYNLVGFCDLTAFEDPEFEGWFTDEYSSYEVYVEDAEILSELTEGVEILVVFATWDEDSRREVPRLARILDSIGFPEDNLILIAVDTDLVVPVEMGALDIQFLPTIMFLHNDEELGRINEKPSTTLENDIAYILSE